MTTLRAALVRLLKATDHATCQTDDENRELLDAWHAADAAIRNDLEAIEAQAKERAVQLFGGRISER